MVITLSLFYYLYLIIVGIFLLYSFFNIYHLLRYGFFSAANILIIIVYLLAAGTTLFVSYQVLAGFNWDIVVFTYELPQIFK